MCLSVICTGDSITVTKLTYFTFIIKGNGVYSTHGGSIRRQYFDLSVFLYFEEMPKRDCTKVMGGRTKGRILLVESPHVTNCAN